MVLLRVTGLLLLFVPTAVGSSSNYVDWLVKSVCEGSDGVLLTNDPFYGCPPSAKLRKIEAGDWMPYNNYEQMGYQISDSFTITGSNGQALYFHTFDYEPFNEYNQYSGSDGYDVYSINSNTVSISNTKDGGGYGSTFFGSGCSFGNGWALFPTTNFLSASQGYWPISGVYWEKNAQSSPGKCPSSYSTNTLTSWSLQDAFSFGGVNGNAVKVMQALVSFHGFETAADGYSPTSNFLSNGHLEVFYFTELYGLTRWEVWTPTANTNTTTSMRKGSVQASSECSGAGTGVYHGVSFTITSCHDWSNVKPSTSPTAPQWPLVNANLLQHPHFEAGSLSSSGCTQGKWCRFGSSPAGNLINWTPSTSTAGGDASGGTGVAYLAVNCGAGSDQQCGAPGTQAVYQDIVVDPATVCGDCAYLYGVNARAQPGGGTGSLQLAVQLLSNGTVLWQDVLADSAVKEDNGDGRGSEASSVYLSSKFIHKYVVLPASVLQKLASVESAVPGSGASVLRFLILPTTPNTFDIVDAFVNRFPVQK